MSLLSPDPLVPKPAHRRGRYAPSPSGPLHLGNLRTALLAWLQARLSDAVYVLRMEDLDLPRMKPGSAEAMLDNLHWLGLDWDEGPGLGHHDDLYYQSKRTTYYDQALADLEARGLVYRCYCSRKDIQLAASAPHAGQGMPPYPGTCRDLSPAAEAAVKRAKPLRKPAYRFKAPDRTFGFQDRLIGHFEQHLARDVGDFVVKRADGLYAYQLAVVIDDGLMGVTDVLRGRDLLDSTPRQMALFEALGFPIPNFWHVPLVMNDQGKRLAKRDGSTGLDVLRAKGLSSTQIIGLLASSLGWIPPGEAITPQALRDLLTIQSFQKSLQHPVAEPSNWLNIT